MSLQPARLETAPDGTPLIVVPGGRWRAAPDALPAIRHDLLGGNDLPSRWQARERFVILDTGFGTGLRFLAAWQQWRTDPLRCRRLHFIACENHPLAAPDLARALRPWPELAELASALVACWPVLTSGLHRLRLDGGQVVLTLFFGDAAAQLRSIDAGVDAFFVDRPPFEGDARLSLPGVAKALARLAAQGATLAGCPEAHPLGEALAASEFLLERRPGFAGRSPMLVGRFRSRRPDRHPVPAERRALVIGAGLAGSTSAHRLAAEGWQVTVLEAAAAPGTGASGNLAGVLRPLPSADDNRLSRLTRAGYLATRTLLTELPDARWSPCGVLHLGREPIHEAQQQRAVEALAWPSELCQFFDRAAASQRLGRAVGTGGWWFPGGGWVQPGSLCRAALAAFPERIELRCAVAVDRLEPWDSGWRAVDRDGQVLGEAPVLIMAGGVAATGFAPFAWLPQRAARGQVSHLPATATAGLDVVVCGQGYVAPAVDGVRLAGATLGVGDDDPGERSADHRENLARLELMLPGFAVGIDVDSLAGRVGFRPMSPDRLPIVGPLPDPQRAGGHPRLAALPRHPGLWCNLGFGARGIVWSALMADLLVSRLQGDPLPLENDLVDALDPGRFLLKPARR
jgi:tRNA 5-methylaminomethyl-2-thiouridine biosynthesis bifunctional protein